MIAHFAELIHRTYEKVVGFFVFFFYSQTHKRGELNAWNGNDQAYFC